VVDKAGHVSHQAGLLVQSSCSTRAAVFGDVAATSADRVGRLYDEPDITPNIF
jgi:hypothetical protein